MFPANFFSALAFQDKVIKLQDNVIKCLKNLNTIKPAQLDKFPDFNKWVEELKTYKKNPLFAEIDNKLQHEAELTIEQMSKYIDDKPAATATAAAPAAAVATDCVIQIPSDVHIQQMVHMAAGAKEDQSKRLAHMVQTVKMVNTQFPLPLIYSDKINLGAEWAALFTAINKGEKENAIILFRKISATNWLFKSLLSVHTPAYIEHIIEQCVKASSLSTATKPGIIAENQDLIFTPKTFELLIYDIATTLQNPAKVKFSFGLPSHHAFSSMGSGFCMLNKTAILLSYLESIKPKALKYVIVGSDVNQDDGLRDILMRLASTFDISHIDIFDPRVYPYQNDASIDKATGLKSQAINKSKVKFWQHNQLTYYAVDLSQVTRTNNSRIHPALTFALKKIKESIEVAKKTGQKVMILLPTGWDSHKDETAPCGKWVNGQMMGDSEAGRTRFHDDDLKFFYTQIFAMYKNHSSFIEGIYWGLEGGYDKAMYVKQIQLMLQVVVKNLLQPQVAPTTTAAHGTATAAHGTAAAAHGSATAAQGSAAGAQGSATAAQGTTATAIQESVPMKLG